MNSDKPRNKANEVQRKTVGNDEVLAERILKLELAMSFLLVELRRSRVEQNSVLLTKALSDKSLNRIEKFLSAS